MSVTTLLDQLPLLAAAPEGVKRLRELILELAVRGKLVPQDPANEPASELLKRIQAEKAKLVAEGKIKKDKPLPEIGEDEKPFELPEGWEWVRLGNLLPFRIGKTPATKESKYWVGGIHPWVSIADMTHLAELHDTARKLSDAGAAAFGYEPLPVGTLLMSFKLTIGKVAVLGIPAYHNEAIASFLPLGGLDTNFLKYVLPLSAMNGTSKNALMGATLNSESLGNLLLGVPPAPEQHRIVAKVDELMALCDKLEAQQADAASAHATLVKALLDTLAQSQSVADFAANWQRIAQHFDTLFTTEASIDALKQTLLQLAVMGKLVPQEPSDEPASELLKRIQAEKAKLVAEGRIKKDKLLPEIGEDEKPFELPQGWKWVRVADLLPEFQNGVSSRGDAGGEQVTVLRLADIKEGKVSLADTRSLPIEPSAIPKYRLRDGDILIIRVNGSADIVGRFVAVGDVSEAIYCDHFIRLHIHQDFVHHRFLALVGASKLARDKINDLFITTAGQKTINQGHISSLVIPLMSVAEQHRIVARVDELMALCDQLTDRLKAARELAAHYASAATEAVLEAA